jgi:multidrug resistance efflux pump
MEGAWIGFRLAFRAWEGIHRGAFPIFARRNGTCLSSIQKTRPTGTIVSTSEHRSKFQDRQDDLQAEQPGTLSERVLALRLPRQAASARSPGATLAWLVAGSLAVVVAILAYLLLKQPRPELAVAPPPAAGADPEPAVAASGSIALDSKGYVIPVRQILVSPKVSGMIMKSYILEGRRVVKGEVLAELEDIDYRADHTRAVFALESARQRLSELETSRPKEIGQAEAEMQESRALLVQLKSDYERSRELFAHKAVAQLDYELAESKYLSTEQKVKGLDFALRLMESSREKRIAAAKADVEAAQADLVKAKWRLDNCIIRAPVSGTILKKNAEEGNIVNPIAMNGSFSLCDLADLADLEVELTIQERDISKVSVGQKCQVRAEAFADRMYQGVVSRLMPIADRAKGAIPVRVKVIVPREEEGVYLKPEMSALVSFLAERSPGAANCPGKKAAAHPADPGRPRVAQEHPAK